MQNQALALARQSLEATMRDLKNNMDDTQSMYHELFVNILSIQRHLQDTLQYLYNAEQISQ